MKRRNMSRIMDPAMLTKDALAALERAGFSRRDFLKGTGALVVGFTVAGGAGKGRALHAAIEQALDVPVDQVDSWIAIAQDESVTGYSGKCEFGQGFRTVQYQLIADELYVPLERITLVVCDTAVTPDQGTTSGSQSHPTEFGPNGLRQALATAREALFAMASDQLGVPLDRLSVRAGVMFVTADPSQQATYGQLIGGGRVNLMVDADAGPQDPNPYTGLRNSIPPYRNSDKNKWRLP